MALGEFDLIDRYFRPLGCPGVAREDVLLGVGDDAALLRPPPGQLLVAALDTLVEGRHFPPGCDPVSIGHRALAVNLSDLAAMGAEPAWALLALTLPAADPAFLQGFAEGFAALARAHRVALVGGDTTAGPLTVSVQVLGFAAEAQVLRRSGGQPGDLLFVSGTPGDASAGLAVEQGRLPVAQPCAEILRRRFLFPTPRLELGRYLRGLASACIDVSDGLAGDVGKLAQASGCGAALEVEDLPLSAALRQALGGKAREAALTGGDDYELAFALPPGRLGELAEALRASGTAAACIGRLEAEPGLRLFARGKPLPPVAGGYDHFTNAG